MVAFFLKIYGHVQGVGFRHFAYRLAQRFNVKGFVRNAEDGTVEIHVEGESEDVERFLKEVTRGPTMAVVTDVRSQAVNPQGYVDFTITR